MVRRSSVLPLALAALVRPAPPAVAAPPTPAPVPAAEVAAETRAALLCWRRLVVLDLSASTRPRLAWKAVDRLLATHHGRLLVLELCEVLTDRSTGQPRSTIAVHLVDQLPDSSDGAEGCFAPPRPGAERYELSIRARYLAAAGEAADLVFDTYPANPECAIVSFYRDAASAMAETLYHELLHVWFVNAFAGRRLAYPTGHGDVARCELDEAFRERLAANASELAELEGHAPRPIVATGAGGR